MRIATFLAIAITAASACTSAAQAAEKTAAPPPAMPPVFTPVPAGPNGQPTAPAGKPAPFTAEMSAEFMRKVMETSAKIEGIKKQMADRRAELFASNTEIKALREEMVSLQQKINAILAQDRNLTKMTMERDMLWTTMPSMPDARMRSGAGAPVGLFPMMGK